VHLFFGLNLNDKTYSLAVLEETISLGDDPILMVPIGRLIRVYKVIHFSEINKRLHIVMHPKHAPHPKFYINNYLELKIKKVNSV